MAGGRVTGAHSPPTELPVMPTQAPDLPDEARSTQGPDKSTHGQHFATIFTPAWRCKAYCGFDSRRLNHFLFNNNNVLQTDFHR